MIDVIPARPFMADFLKLQPTQINAGQIMEPGAVEAAIKGGLALAAVSDGEVLCMGGLYEIWPGRAMAWALVSEKAGPALVSLSRVCRRAFDYSTFERIEAYILDHHAAAHRWAELLGFEREGVMRNYWHGENYALYSRVK